MQTLDFRSSRRHARNRYRLRDRPLFLPGALIMATHSEAIGARADRVLRLDELARRQVTPP